MISVVKHALMITSFVAVMMLVGLSIGALLMATGH